jgi:hypothetical protein
MSEETYGPIEGEEKEMDEVGQRQRWGTNGTWERAYKFSRVIVILSRCVHKYVHRGTSTSLAILSKGGHSVWKVRAVDELDRGRS